MEANAIEVEGLRKVYAAAGNQPPKVALRGLDLEVPRGAIFGLLGPNGAGKSTLINILAGLVIKTSGRVRIWGFDQDRNPRQSRAAIGVMPQELNLDPFFAPREALEVQAGLYGVPKAERRTDEILALVGLEDQADAYARNLSGGMRRRLLLAKALVHHPHVLVLDEPTAGVDIELRQMLWTNVRRLNAEGMTIILTTHYLEEAEAMCDEIAIIDKGELIARDRKDNLLRRLDRKTLIVTPGGSVSGNAVAAAMPDGVGLEARPDGSLAISYSRSRTSVDAILRPLLNAGVPILDVATVEPSLEDVFVELTSGRRTAPARDG
ncbi:MAG: ABC transporter ATP-binding protein [Alphaproteobacteria bacterium]|nr:MAG: ABC transporter ATP-binding protein [Alphaproteobacteria bacterium]